VPSAAWLDADWPAPGRVRGLTTLRGGAGQSRAPFDRLNLGAHCGDAPEDVAANRAWLVSALALPGAPHWLEQVHGVEVVRFQGPPEPGQRLRADAAVTDAPGVVLAILSADCLPVLLAARDGSEVGAAHAGWRGLAAGVLEATVAAMHTPPAGLLAWLGPAAGPAAYEVGEEVRAAFVDADSAADAAFHGTRPGHWHADLYALARRRLASVGVTAVSGGTRCTLSEPQAFFSHRRDGRSGRMATLAWLSP
jgi:YfiH family protein